jgi:23S rRNA (guanosine2251-2'-O)-methyltransferase
MRKLRMEELGRLSPGAYRAARKRPLLLVLENIRSMHNVGSIFRTADAFLVEKLCLCGFTPCPPHRDIHKTALGATETVEWEQTADPTTLLKRLRGEGYRVLALEQTEDSTGLQSFAPLPDEKIAVVLGNEVEGVSDAALACCDGSIEIPQFGSKHSLNVSVAAGLLLWEFARSAFTEQKDSSLTHVAG